MLEAHKYHCSVRVLYPTRLCLQCACDSLKKNFIFRFIAASLACILVRLLSNAHPVSVRVASRKKKYHKWHKAAVVQRNKENLC